MCRISKIKYLRSGLTLMEVILVIALLSILLGAITLTMVTGLKAWDSGILSAGVKKDASYSLRIIAEELKQATAITAANQNNMTFSADLDGNGVDETITYTWSGTAGDAFNRTEGLTTTILARDAQNAQFQYYNASNTLLSFPVTASQVRVVELTLQLQREAETAQYMIKVRPRGI